MRAHRLLVYLLKLYHSEDWRNKSRVKFWGPFPSWVIGRLGAGDTARLGAAFPGQFGADTLETRAKRPRA